MLILRNQLRLQVVQNQIRGWVDDRLLFDVHDTNRVLDGGGIALICADGCMATDAVSVGPAE